MSFQYCKSVLTVMVDEICYILILTIRGTVEERKKELRDFGVFYEDDYDYLQHLKPRTDTSLEPLPGNVTVIEAKKSDVKKACSIHVHFIIQSCY